MPTAVPIQATTAYAYMKYTYLTLSPPPLLSNIMLGTQAPSKDPGIIPH